MTTFVAESMHRDECIRLLGATSLARIVISVKCLPVALPARMSLVDPDNVILASADPAVILAARRNDVISIQIDGIDNDGLTWSVMASGIARVPDGDEPLNEGLTSAIARGGALVKLPLSVVVGQRG